MVSDQIDKKYSKLYSYLSKILYDLQLYDKINWTYFVEYFDFSKNAPYDRFWRSMEWGDPDIPDWLNSFFKLSYDDDSENAILMLIEICEEVIEILENPSRHMQERSGLDTIARAYKKLNDDYIALKEIEGSIIPKKVHSSTAIHSQKYEIQPNIQPLKMEFEKEFIFVLLPFDELYSNHFKSILEPTSKKFGLDCIRADSLRKPGKGIIEKIYQLIISAKIIIADITELNPNVMYELGVSDAFGKPIVMMVNKERLPFDEKGHKKLPFDVGHREILHYDTSTQTGFDTWKIELMENLKSLK